MVMKVVKKQIARKKSDGPHARFSDKQKLAIVSTWMLTGSPTLTAEQHGCHIKSIEYWKRQKWWKDAVNEIKASRNHEMSSKMKKLFDRSINQLEDRVEHGEYIFDQKTGAIRRVPVNSRNLNQIARDSIDRQLLLDKVTAAPTVEQVDISQRLNQLMDEFKKFASTNGAHKPKGEVIDVQEIVRDVEEPIQEAIEYDGSSEDSSDPRDNFDSDGSDSSPSEHSDGASGYHPTFSPGSDA